MATVHPSIDDVLARWILQQHVFFIATGKGSEGIAAYQAENNRISLNGLPAVEPQ